MPIIPTTVGDRRPYVVPSTVGYMVVERALNEIGFLDADVKIQAAMSGDTAVQGELITALLEAKGSIKGEVGVRAGIAADYLIRLFMEGD